MPFNNKVISIFVFLITLTIITVTITSYMITKRQQGSDYYYYYVPWSFVDDNNDTVGSGNNDFSRIIDDNQAKSRMFTTTTTKNSSNLLTTPSPSSSESLSSWKDEYDHEINRFVKKYSRIWNVKSHHQWWSKQKSDNDNNNNNHDDNGLWFIKVPKSASSTIAGIVFNLQHYYDHYCCTLINNNNHTTTSSSNNNNNNSNVQSLIHWEHGKAQDIFNIDRIYDNRYFLFAPIRLPDKRALSDIYFHRISFHRRSSSRSRNQSNDSNKELLEDRIPNDNYIFKYLEKDITSNYIYNYIKLQTTTTNKTHNDPIEDIMRSMIHDNSNKKEEIKWRSNNNDNSNTLLNNSSSNNNTNKKLSINIPINIEEEIQTIMNTYNFMIVVERIDESIVVLSYLMNIPIQYFITISSKISNSWYYQKPQNKKPNYCMKLISSVVSNNINEYFQSETWLNKHQYDYILYHIANRSLDLTIEAIDRELLSTSMTKGNNNNVTTIRSIAEMIVEYKAMKEHAENICIVSSSSTSTSTTTAGAKNITTTTTDDDDSHDYFYSPPCSENGIPQLEKSKLNCHYRDFGCGHYCIYQTLLSSSFNASLTKQQQ